MNQNNQEENIEIDGKISLLLEYKIFIVYVMTTSCYWWYSDRVKQSLFSNFSSPSKQD